MPRSMLIEFRRDSAANWTATNPVLAAGEPGWESDTDKLKIGDGATAWNALGYFGGAGSSPLTTKGDLYGHAAADARIPVGTDNQVLVADSAQALGVKWAPAPAGSGGALTLIGSQSLGVAGASLSVGSIPATYTSLLVVLSVKSAAAVLQENMVVNFNADTTVANYATQTTFSHGSTVSGQSITTTAGLGIQVIGSSGAHSYFSAVSILIPRYNLTAADVDKIVQFSTVSLATGPVLTTLNGCGSWSGASAAITTITAKLASAANFVAQSYISVYGMA